VEWPLPPGVGEPSEVFPWIESIEDVLPCIQGREEFLVAKRHDCTVVRYLLLGDGTFDHVEDLGVRNTQIRRECRGLVFGESGRLIARPYHKFFNVNERDETGLDLIDLESGHRILQKLDGSMVFPVVIDGSLRLHTKAGISDTAMHAEVFLARNPALLDFMFALDREGSTPIFEWCSRRDPIVLDYPVDQMILTAIRKKNTGHYLDAGTMTSVAEHFGVPVVGSSHGAFSEEGLLTVVGEVRGRVDDEGVVIRFDNGEMVKIKSEDYVFKHSALSGFTTRRAHAKTILEDRLDDILPLLPKSRRDDVLEFRGNLLGGIGRWAEYATKEFGEIENSVGLDASRKDYAREIKRRDGRIHSLLFAILDGQDPVSTLRDRVLTSCGSASSLKKLQWVME
jgi:RNA ligase